MELQFVTVTELVNKGFVTEISKLGTNLAFFSNAYSNLIIATYEVVV